jgi:uncharacterized protein YgbK (DUF1537 family)
MSSAATSASSPADSLLAAFDNALGRLDLNRRRKTWTRDPVSWVQDRLGEHVWSKQREVMTALQAHRRVAVRSCHGVGKSHIASRAAAWWLDAHPPGQAFVVTTAPTFPQVRAILWRYIRQAHRAGNLPTRRAASLNSCGSPRTR